MRVCQELIGTPCIIHALVRDTHTHTRVASMFTRCEIDIRATRIFMCIRAHALRETNVCFRIGAGNIARRRERRTQILLLGAET